VRRVCYRYQRTLGRAVEVQGIGYLTGANVRLRFLAAPPHTGVVFLRTDLGPGARVEATVAEVTGTNRRTTQAGRRSASAWSSTSWPPSPACVLTTALWR
jgi:UDP-3-O-[3-hydroxymyristoyl] N-acetylglucosamine deacetylase